MTTTKKPAKGKADLTVVGAGNRKVPVRDRNRAVVAEQKRLDDEARDAECWLMKKDGKTLVQIADHFGWASPNSASLAAKRHVSRTPRPEVEEVRLTEVTRLDQIAVALMDQMMSVPPPDPDDLSKMASAYVRVSTRKAAYTGADEPKRAELTGRDGGPIRITSEEERIAWMKAAKSSLDRRLQAVE